MENLRDEIADLCVRIEVLTERYGIPMRKVTVIVRDPANDRMFAVVSNEGSMENLKVAAKFVTEPPAGCTLELAVPAPSAEKKEGT